MKFSLDAPFTPKGDQPQAIKSLSTGINDGLKHQVLLGVTGSGKTYTIANVIESIQKPTLIISHNKTLAAQLYQEFKAFFPKNAVSYFVSYYDYYQPEAYIPRTDTYIAKETEINEEIDKLRLAATTNLLTRKDTIIVASVSCIYNLGNPKQYGSFILELRSGMQISRQSIARRLVDMQYTKTNYEFVRSTFRIRADTIDIFPSYDDRAIRLLIHDDKIEGISYFDAMTGVDTQVENALVIYPAKHYITDRSAQKEAISCIRVDLDTRIKELLDSGKQLEAHRLTQKVNYDIEMIEEIGYINGIENYSRYFDGRLPGQAPYTLLDYFLDPYKSDWLLIVDESHMTIPQIRGMYTGDRSRKQTLIDYGFRLPSAADNRPLTFMEFSKRIPQTIYVSATPDEWELSLASESASAKSSVRTYSGVTEQLIRPTGIIDPEIVIKPTSGQIDDLVTQIFIRKKRKQRTLVTTLTKKMAEDLATYLHERKYVQDMKGKYDDSTEFPTVHYLHSDIKTLVRTDILDDLRMGKYDVIIGINLLREGLDLPEVSLVVILDADKEGFLRSRTSLIQTMGRAARHTEGQIIMYADITTRSMKSAINEIKRRRTIQQEYNQKYNITAHSIQKPVREKLVEKIDEKKLEEFTLLDSKKRIEYKKLLSIDENQLTPRDRTKLIKKMEKQMREAASFLNFELAAELRDKIRQIQL